MNQGDQGRGLASSIELLTTDFDRCYEKYLRALDERSTLERLSVTVLTAPLVLVGTVNPEVLKTVPSIDSIPVPISLLLLLCGWGSFVLFLRIVKTYVAICKFARDLNAFRELYTAQQIALYAAARWTHPLGHLTRDYPHPKVKNQITGALFFSVVPWASGYLALGGVGTLSACGIESRWPEEWYTWVAVMVAGILSHAVATAMASRRTNNHDAQTIDEEAGRADEGIA